jgi:hypothetical protein
MSLDDDARAEGQSLDHHAAVELNEQIREIADKAGQHLDYLADLLVEATAGKVHEALGFPNWTAYLAERLKPITKALNRSSCSPWRWSCMSTA